MAFPVTGILDDFNRANSGSLGSNWTTNVEGIATGAHGITSNQATPVGNVASSWWNVATVGPDCESRITIVTKPGSGFAIRAFARLQSPGSAACDGYASSISVNAGTDTMAIYRLDNGVYTQLGAAVTEERSNGDEIGLECIGTTHAGYIGATSKLSRTDSTYTGAGYIGFEGDQTGAGVYDNFGGGTISSTVSLAGTIDTTLTFSGDVAPATSLAGTIPLTLAFAGDVTPGNALGGTIDTSLVFGGAAENVPMDMAGSVTLDLDFTGNLSSAPPPSGISLAGNITGPQLAFSGTLSGGLDAPPPVAEPRHNGGPLPWMVFGGVEIGNAARTLAYLGNRYDAESNPQGLAGIYDGWRVGNGDCCFCPVLATDGAGVEVDFLRPDDIGVSVGDPAPWYDPAVPESAHFLGALITQITGLDSTVGRAKVERAAGLGGAALGAQRAGGREIAVRATLVATSCPGLDYGRRWLSHALANDLCDDCETYQLELRTTCPPADRPDVGLVNLYEVGLSEGPKIVRDGGLPDCCDLLEVEWTLTAGNPLVYACPVEVVPFTPAPDGVTVSGTIDPPEPFGTIAALIEVRTGTVAGQGILVRAWDQLLGDPCPGATDEECLSIQLAGLPDGVVVTIDGARQRLVVTDVAGVESDGLPYVVMSDGEAFDWPEFVGCQRVCVAVSVSADPGPGDPVGAAVAISSQHRFLA